MTTIKRTTLLLVTNEAIDATAVPLIPSLKAKLRETARTTDAFGDNFNTSPPCIAGQAVPYPFDAHGCSDEEHSALIVFGCAFDRALAGRGLPNDDSRTEVIDA